MYNSILLFIPMSLKLLLFTRFSNLNCAFLLYPSCVTHVLAKLVIYLIILSDKHKMELLNMPFLHPTIKSFMHPLFFSVLGYHTTTPYSRCTKPRCQVTQATKFWRVLTNMCGFSVWKLLRTILLAARILRLHLDFWNIYTPVFYTLLLGWITDFHIPTKQKAELYSTCTF